MFSTNWRRARRTAYGDRAVPGFDARRTQVAQSAFDFSNYFAQAFGNVRVLGAVVRKPELMAPEGMSTGGGRRARQPIVLLPEGTAAYVGGPAGPMSQGPMSQAPTSMSPASGPAITIGWVDIPQRKASLRTHRCLVGVHQARYRGRPLDIDKTSYDAFFDQAKGLLAACGLAVTEEDEVHSSVPPPPLGEVVSETSGPSFFTTAAIAFVAFVLGAFAGGLAVYARFVGF